MSKQTAISNVNRMILEDRQNGTSRTRTDWMDKRLKELEEEEKKRKQEEEERQRAREQEERQRQQARLNAKSAADVMGLVKSYGDIAAERKAAETPVQTPAQTRTQPTAGTNRLTPAIEAEYQARNSNRLTPYMQYMQAQTARAPEETRSGGIQPVSGGHQAQRRSYTSPSTERTREERRTYGMDTTLPEGRYSKITIPETKANRTVSAIYNDAATMTRWRELASKDKLTAEEKREAQAATKDLHYAFNHYDAPPTGAEMAQRIELTNLYNSLLYKSNALASGFAGTVKALGIDWLSDRLTGAAEKALDAESPYSSMREITGAAQKANPAAFTVGNIAGSTAEMLGISGMVGNAMKGVKWFTDAPQWIQRAVSSGITFGANGLQSGITSTMTKEEWDEQERQNAALAADFGASYTPRDYSVGRQLANVGISTATGALAGAAGGALETAFGIGTSKALIRYGLQYNTLFRALANGINGVGFAAGSTSIQEASKYLQYPEGYTASASEIASNMAVAFLFSSVSSIISDVKAAPQNRENLLKMMDELTREYAEVEMKMAGMTEGPRRETAQKVTELTARIRNSIATSRGMSGVSNEVKALAAALDIIDDRMAAIIAGGNGLLGAGDILAQAEAAGFTPNTALQLPAWNGASSQPTNLEQAVQIVGGNVPAPRGETVTLPESPAQTNELPAWYAAYQNTPRPIDQPTQQRPNIPAPAATPATPAQEAPQQAETAPAPPVPQSAAETPTETPTKAPGTPPVPQRTAPAEQQNTPPVPKNGSANPNGSGLLLPTAEPLTQEQEGGKMEPVEKAKQELRGTIRMPVQGKNVEALEQGAKTGELTTDSVTIGAKVPGFTREQQTSLATQIIEGVQNGQNEITAKVPDDGTFTVPNQPGNVAQVLNGLKVKAKQETEITQGIDHFMRNNSSAAVTKIGDQSYIGDKYALVAVSDSAAEFAAKQYNANRMNLVKDKFDNMLGNIAETGTPLAEQPKIYEFGRNQIYGIDTPQGIRTISRRNAEFIQGGQLYVSDNGNYLVSVNPDGSIRGFAALSNKLPAAAKQIGFGKLKGVGPGIQKEAIQGDATPQEQTEGLSLAPKETPAPEPKKLTLPTAEETPKEAAGAQKPHEKLAESLIAELEEGNTITSQQLQKLADAAFGGTRSSGAYDIKTAYDSLELAVNKYLMGADFVQNANGDAASAVRTEEGLQQFMGLLPTQTVRTDEQQAFQQFSTPPNIAYLAAWAANIGAGDTVLEPSAGIGGLALWPKAWGATVYGNELSQRRAEILRSLGLDEVFTENAEQINNVLPDYVKPSVVLMNPPFSATAGRLSTNSTANAKRHIEQALDRLEDGGRLVAILGRGMSNDSKTFASWWDDLRKEYDIKANLSINGENYKKYGTTFDVQLVVIDKTGPQAGETITGSYDDLTEIPQVLEGIRNDRTQLEASTGNAGERGVLEHAGSERNRPVSARPSGNDQRPAGNPAGNVGSAAQGSSGNGGRAQHGRTGENGLRIGASDGKRVGGESTDGAGSLPAESEPKRGAGPESELSVPRVTEEPAAKPEKRTAAAKQKAGNDDGVYAEYIPPKTPVKGTKKHPAQIVESAAMAAVDAPQATYVPNLPKELITSGALSDVQLTNIVYAGQAHSQMIPNQNIRRGYFIGDGTGVGKGRQIAGIILDNFRQGRTKAVWISQRQNLLSDAKRDWKAMGMNEKDVLATAKIKADKAIDAPTGILFTTYDTLAKASKAGNSRLDQIVNWLGPDFDGVIALDEAHTMGNLLGKKGTRGNSKPSDRAIAGAELQKRLPNARIVYASATMATDVSEMAFADRLGLWGPGTQFANVRDFVEKISSGGMAAMELVARDMKAMGLYQARSISYNGVQYDTIQHDLTPMQKEIYDTMSRAWQVTLKHMNEALEMTGANLNGSAKSAAKSAYYGALQRFYNQILTSMSMPSVIEDIKKELAAGKSCVLQIVNTNEAETNRQLAKIQETDGDLEDLDITPRENLIGFFRNSFPVQVYEEYEDDNGNKRSRPVTDSKGNPVLDKKAVALRDRMIAEIEGMSVPEGPMEMLFDAFGVDQVAEVTGRKRRIVPGKDEYGNTVRVEEKRGSGSGEADAQAFQDGKKHILVFSDAGGTGKSYHADRTAKNQEQRVHYLVQAGWSAPKAVQGFGRTNRSNQVSAPIYKLVTTDVKGQKRFISTIARRLDQLGALTKGQRQTGSGVFSARDNLESDLATDTLYNFYQALVRGQLEGLDAVSVLEKLGILDKFTDKETGRIKVPDGDGRNMNLFLNRILALEYDEQNMVFDTYNRMLDDAYETALANGTLDMGMETVRADKIDIVDDMTVREDPETGVMTNYVQAKLSEKARIVRTVDDLKALRGDFIGIYRKKNGEAVGVFRTKDKTETNGNVVKQYILQSPLERKFSRYVEATLKKECERLPEKEWGKAWKAEVEKTPEYTETIKHMLTGSLLPIWNKLPQSGNVRVQRLIADDGRQYLGRIIDPSQIDSVLKSLGVTKGRTKQTYTADDVIKRVLKDGDKATLENNRIVLSRRRVGGEMRIEVTGDNLWYLLRTNPDIISETINYRPRYFLPTGDRQKPALEKLLKENPVLEIVQVRGGEAEDSRDTQNFTGNTAPKHPENWTAERVGDKDKTPMSLPDIVEMIRHDFDIPVSTGNIRTPNARAQYRKLPQSVRSKVANSIPDIAHELGHHLDNLYDIRAKISAKAKQEIIDAMPDSFKNQYKKNELPGEGIAEFLRRYLQNSETAKMDFPTFYEEFFSVMDRKAIASLEKLADEVNAYYSLSEETGNWPVHNREERGKDYRTLGEKLKDMNTHFRTLFIDSMEPIRQADAATGGNAHMYAINSAYAGNRAYAAITGDLYDLRGNKLGEGLQKALEGIHVNRKQEYNDFGMYLICRHGPERLAEGMRVFSNDAWDNTDYMESVVQEMEAKYPEFAEAAERLEEFQKNVLEAYGVDSGLYSKDTIKEWFERWEHYVPFNRWFGDTESKAKGQKRGFANQSGPYRKAVGSGRDIINPVDNICENTVRLITTSIYNDVMQRLTKEVGNTEGMGWLMEKVPMPLARKTWNGKGLKAKTLDEFDEYFKAKGKDLGEKGLDLIQQILDSAIDDLLVQYGRGKAHGDIVTVMKDGTPEYWKVNDPDLLRTLTNMGPGRASPIIQELGRINRFITGNITGMNVVWSVASNMPRDLGTMFTFSKTKNLVKILTGIGESYVNSFKGDKADELYKEFLALGGTSTGAQTADKNMARKAMKAIQKKWTDWLNPLEAVEFIGDMIERGPRYSYYKICRTKYGMSQEEAFYAAMEITTNFKRAGLLGREINMVIPFFNASVQGVDRAARWLEADDIPQADRKKARTGRIAAYLGASLAIAALSMGLNLSSKKKRDNLEKLSSFTKNNYFVIPLKNGKYAAIPKPRELAIPISLFERLIEVSVGQNPHAMDDFWEYATDNLLPGVLSGLAQGDLNSAIGDLGVVGSLHYLVSNQDFLGRPIVSTGLEKLEPKDQYNNNTSKLAYLIGQAFNLSPQQIDFLGNEIFGGFWSWQKALAPVGGERDLTLGVKGKWVKDPLYSTDISNRLYEARDRLERKKNSNPGDVQAAVNYRTVSDMATFYGRYYRLARSEKETEHSREIRTAMLDMILGVERGDMDSDPARRFMIGVLENEGGSALMPTVLDVTVKSDEGTTYDLNSEEYFMMQTRYNSLYYNYIREAMNRQPSMTAEEKAATVEAAKTIAGIVARGETITGKGGSYEKYDKLKALEDEDIDEGELMNFLAAYAVANSDGKVTNTELMGAAGGLKLPTITEQAALVGYKNESLGLKLKAVSDYDVDANDYQAVLAALDGNNLNQANAVDAIDAVYGPTTARNRAEKAAMWQALNKGWKAAKNPYDPDVSTEVQNKLRLPTE